MTRRILIRLAQLPIRFYQSCISPYLVPSCRFSPSCSSYALEALEKHGISKGGLLGLRRLARCHPFCKSCGFDPVPEQFDWTDFISYKRPNLPTKKKQEKDLSAS